MFILQQDIEEIAEKFLESTSNEDFDLDSDTDEVKSLAPIMLTETVIDGGGKQQASQREITPPKGASTSDEPTTGQGEEEEEVLTQRQTEDNNVDGGSTQVSHVHLLTVMIMIKYILSGISIL